ncbi:Protein IWS1-like protein [Trichoplax sp. H2]|nr:Protein IWS1-like protein [Trichoplax sp. H2]|eukprot:RDD40898.1 Protein IWS1-like protein [Trichoplax sp. H2]
MDEEELQKKEMANSDEYEDSAGETYNGKSMQDTRKYFDDSSDDDDDDEKQEEKSGAVKSESRKSTDNATQNAGHLMDEIFGSSDEEEFEGFQDGDDNFLASSGQVLKHELNIDDKETAQAFEEDKNDEKIAEDAYERDREDDKADDDDDIAYREDEFQEGDDEGDQIQDVEDEEARSISNQTSMTDFEIMIEKKKRMNKKGRRRNEDEDLTGFDDKVKAVVIEMHEIAKKDRHLNKKGEAAINKLKHLSAVTEDLKKLELLSYFLENGILTAISDWLSPLPDRSLPNVKIRYEMLRILDSFPPIDTVALKESKIGGVVNYLSNHPEETKANRELADKLIKKWSRTIFNLSTDLKALYREERANRSSVVRDERKKRRISTDDSQGRIKPGEPGWIQRARVPTASTTDYSNRPSYNVEIPLSRKPSKKILNRYEKQLLKFKDKRSKSKQNYKSLPFSIEGRKLSI